MLSSPWNIIYAPFYDLRLSPWCPGINLIKPWNVVCITKNLIVTVWQPIWFFEPLCSILYSHTNGNLCTMTTFLSWRTVHTLTLSWTALQWQLKWPLIKCFINWQNNLLTMGQFFSDWRKSQEWSQKLIHKARWWLIMASYFDCVPLIYTAAVSINCLRYLFILSHHSY